MHAPVPEPATRRPVWEAEGLASADVSALIARGRRLHAEAFNQVINSLVARLRHLVS